MKPSNPAGEPRHDAEVRGDSAPGTALAVLAGVALVLFLYRLWLIVRGTIPLDLEEIYYLYWSLTPDLGYYSKPPMIAWLLALSSQFLGPTVLGIKLVSLILHTATAFPIYAIGRRIHDQRVGLAAALIFLTAPIMGVLALFSTTDAPLHFFWAVTLWLFVVARERGGIAPWVAAGMAGGLGMLSKYSMGILAVALLLHMATSREERRLLVSRGLWLGLLAALLVWSPNLWWNARHHFISFVHTAQISQLAGPLFHPAALASFLAAQFLAFGPLFFAALLWLPWRPGMWRQTSDRLLFWVTFTPLGVIALQALLAEANMNWASPAYVGGSLYCAAGLMHRGRRWLRAGLAVNLLLLIVLYHFEALSRMAGIPPARHHSPYSKRLGWAELGAEVRHMRGACPGATLVSEDRTLLTYLGYYGGEWPPRLASWNPDGAIRNQYDLSTRLVPGGGPYLFLGKGPLPRDVARRFRHVQDLGEARTRVFPDLERRVHLTCLGDFRGYR